MLPVASSRLPRVSLKWLQPGLCEGELEPTWQEQGEEPGFSLQGRGTMEESSVLGRDGASWLCVVGCSESCISIEGPKIDDPGRMSGVYLLKGRAWQARAEPGPSKG